MFDNNVQYEITLTNNSGVDYREWQTGSSVAIGQTIVITITGENLANTIMSNVAQHNALRGRTEIVANAVTVGGSSGGSSGGTADYPSFTGNANKVLAVKATEDGVEWTTALTQVYVDTQDSLLQDQINSKADAMATSQSLALKADLISGLIPASQLPSYVDDVLSFPDLVSFPSLGEDGKIYIAEDVNKTYRWGGSSYVEIGGGGVALGETSSTAYRGDNGKIAYDHSLSQGNPHNTTTSDINEGTKLFFTESRVNQTVLTGLDTSTATPALATDQLLAAIGKLQAQLNASVFNWVDVTTIAGTAMPSSGITLDLANTKIFLAKKDGNLWLKGYFRLASALSSGQGSVFRITDLNWVIDADPNVQAFPASWTLYHPIQPANCFIQLTTTLMDFGVKGSASATGWGYVIYPTCIGKAK